MVFHDGLSCALPMIIVRYMYTTIVYSHNKFQLLNFNCDFDGGMSSKDLFDNHGDLWFRHELLMMLNFNYFHQEKERFIRNKNRSVIIWCMYELCYTFHEIVLKNINLPISKILLIVSNLGDAH